MQKKRPPVALGLASFTETVRPGGDADRESERARDAVSAVSHESVASPRDASAADSCDWSSAGHPVTSILTCCSGAGWRAPIHAVSRASAR